MTRTRLSLILASVAMASVVATPALGTVTLTAKKGTVRALEIGTYTSLTATTDTAGKLEIYESKWPYTTRTVIATEEASAGGSVYADANSDVNTKYTAVLTPPGGAPQQTSAEVPVWRKIALRGSFRRAGSGALYTVSAQIPSVIEPAPYIGRPVRIWMKTPDTGRYFVLQSGRPVTKRTSTGMTFKYMVSPIPDGRWGVKYCFDSAKPTPEGADTGLHNPAGEPGPDKCPSAKRIR